MEVEHELPYEQPPNPNDVHPQFRRARVTAEGNYLLSFLHMNYVVEYDKNFKEIWKYNILSPRAAIRLKWEYTHHRLRKRISLTRRSEFKRRNVMGV